MIKKVIYIGYQPITSKFYSDYYIDMCIRKGLEVEYWDISKLYFPKLNFAIPFDFAGIKNIKSFSELKAFLSSVEVKSTVFISNITYEYRVRRLFILLSTFNCTIAFFGRGMFPAPDKTDTSKILEVILRFDFKRIVTGLKNKVATMLKQYEIVKPYDFIFRAGSEGVKTIGFGYQLELQKSKIIDLNYFDYDKYSESINGIQIIEKVNCVFLDEYLPYHPDFVMLGIKTVTAETYYSQLNRFFDFIESKYNISVIIAAHPKAHKYKSENPFNGREIVFNRTCELVRDAVFVMTHYSSSISYPVLFKRPILFLTSQSQKITMPYSHELTLYLGKFLNSSVIHFDSYNGEDITLKVDIEKYEDYKYKYLTSKESENRQSSEIFIEAIVQI
tara:strand:+ start:12057 stop:13223 length:1167 start_codon:yes stop_codon:yes gene_type:complete